MTPEWSGMLEHEFMRRALIGGALVGFLASYYGAFVVQRGMSFLGSGLAHATFGGVALGLLLGAEPLWVAIPFTLAVAMGIVWVQGHGRLRHDTAIGIFFAVSMALGIVFLSLRRELTADAYSYLFGSILAVTRADLVATSLVVAATLATRRMWGRWAYATFDRELAIADRVPVRMDDYALVGALAVTIVLAVKLVGIVLIAALLVIPAATARQLTRTFFAMTWVSAALGVFGAVAGLAVAWAADLPGGAAIILVEAMVFFAALGWSGMRK